MVVSIFSKIPFGRITKDGQRYLLELTIEDGLGLRKAKRRLKNTFGLEISIDRLWYLLKTTGKKVDAIVTDFDPKYSDIIKNNFPDALHQLCVGHFNNIIDGDLRMASGLKYGKKKELPDEFKELKGKFYYVFSSKNRLISEQRLYSVFQAEYGKNPEIDAILLKIKANFYNLTHFMGDCRIPKTNNFLESRYSTPHSRGSHQ